MTSREIAVVLVAAGSGQRRRTPGGAGKFRADFGHYFGGRRVVVLEDNDRHLRVQLTLQWQGDVLEVATVVHTHNAFGRAYMLPVAPVHRLIVPHLLKKQVQAYR